MVGLETIQELHTLIVIKLIVQSSFHLSYSHVRIVNRLRKFQFQYLNTLWFPCLDMWLLLYSNYIHGICKHVHQNWEDGLGQLHLCFLCRNTLPGQSGQRCRPLLHLAGNPSSPSASASCPAHTHSVRNHTERDGWTMAYDRGRLTTNKSLSNFSIFLDKDVRNFTWHCLEFNPASTYTYIPWQLNKSFLR